METLIPMTEQSPSQLPNSKQPLIKQRGMTTQAWVAIIVGIVMAASGIVFDIDAKSVKDQYDTVSANTKQNASDIKALLTATGTNTANITSLTKSLEHLQGLVEQHVIQDDRRYGK